MSGSIRLRLVDWLERIGDHVPQYLVQVLRGREVHSQPGSDLRDGLVVRVQNHGPEGYGDHAEVLTGFHQQVHVMNGSAIVPNFKELVPEGQLVPALNHDLVCHQKFPLGTVFDLASLNARAFGVEGRLA